MEPQGIWATLGIAPTGDARAIKRAYANASKHCHPEDEPERFRLLHEAYQQALQWARFAPPSDAPPPEPTAPVPPPEPFAFDDLIEEGLAEQEARSRALVAPVMAQLVALYRDPWRRYDRWMWLNAVDTPAFAAVRHHPEFVRRLVILLRHRPVLPAAVKLVFTLCLPEPHIVAQDTTGVYKALEAILNEARAAAAREKAVQDKYAKVGVALGHAVLRALVQPIIRRKGSG